jgi:hypothetical protein
MFAYDTLPLTPSAKTAAFFMKWDAATKREPFGGLLLLTNGLKCE